MTDSILENSLREFDYSVFSKVKDSLLEEILQKYDEGNAQSFKSLSQIMQEEMLSDEELDYLAAAGNPNLDDKAKKII